MAETILARAPRRRTAKPAAAGLLAYNMADGACSLRHVLTARERTALDKALDIVGRRLTAGTVLSSPDAVKAYLRLQLGGEPVEHFAVIFLNSQHRSIAFERMFTGTLTQTSVYPREIVVAALRHNAAAVILAHNHPSGSVEPSHADKALTYTLKEALRLIDVRVLDHIIVGPGAELSMAERGLL